MKSLMVLTSRNKTQSGFTLIEMMIALTIGLFILGALTAVVISGASSTRSNDRTSELQMNGRYALDSIRRDVQHAGNSGLTPSATMSTSKTNGFFSVASGVSVTSDCATGFATELDQAVTGSDDSNPYSACITNYLQGDILVVRYADMQTMAAVSSVTAASAPTFAATNDIYFRSSYAVSTLFQQGGTTPYAVGTGPMQDQLLKTYVYYIGNYSNTPGDNIPALWRVKLSQGTMTPELVASGIEQLQVQYGIGGASNSIQFFDAGNVASWSSVRSVRIWLLARNTSSKESGNYSNTTAYTMGNISYTPPTTFAQNKYRRQLYVATIDMRN